MNGIRGCALALISSLGMAACGGASGPAAVSDPTRYADPRMGSGGYAFAYGAAFPGATGPSGMMRVGPETSGPLGVIRFQHFSGYWANDNVVLGFSHMHLHGTGAVDYGVLGLMPALAFDPTKLRVEDLQSTFAKTSELASPGRYSLTLDSGPIGCDFTALGHSSHERFTYPAAQVNGTIQLDLQHSATSVVAAQLELGADSQSATGQISTSGGMSGGFTVYFAIQFAQAWTAQHVFSDGNAPSGAATASGTGVGAALDFALGGKPLELRVGLSMVSRDGAKANLAAELASSDFDTNAALSRSAWDARLGTAIVYGGTEAQRATFYSALHHAFVMPGVYSDSDGSFHYRSSALHTAGFSFVNDLSLWDTYRTLNPLYDLLAPDLSSNVAASLFAMAQVDGVFPKWPLAASDSGTMIGASAEPVLASAYVKGVRGFDAEAAYQLLRPAALDPSPAIARGGRDSSLEYLTLGYVPADLHNASVSLTTEYATDDEALANFAAALGHADDAALLHTRATGYRKLYDPATNLLRARDASGALHINPTETFNSTSWTDYDEGDAQQYTWAVIHDPAGLALTFGGQPAMLTVLNTFFANSAAERTSDLAAAGSDDGIDQLAQARNLPAYFYWAGNEIDLNAPLQYARQGRPDLTAQWTVWTRTHFFSSAPDGLPGNDDGGTMSAWYFFSALGIFPIPGSDRYLIASPLFPRVDLHVAGGTFSIIANGVSDANLYVQSAKLNGAALTSAELTHADLHAGGSLELQMGPAPSSWGAAQ